MLTKKIQSIHFFPVKGMQGFEKEKCILQKNKLIENDRQFALIQIPKQRTSYSTPWLPKTHFKQLVNQPTLAKIGLKLLISKPLILKIDNFFTKRESDKIKKRYGDFDIITANHVCAHVENLSDFFSGVQNLLKKDGLFIFEISYRASVLKKNTFDTIYHEHLDYHALYPICKFVKKFNLNVINFKTPDAQGGSLRVYASKNKNIRIKKNIKKQILKEKKTLNLFKTVTYKKFEKKIADCKYKLHSIIQNCKKNHMNFAGYGAAAKTTTFLNYFDISEKDIQFIFDDNKLKHGLCIPGTKINILNPSVLDRKKIDVLIIFAWNYADIIIKKNKKFQKKGGKFLIPFPKPRLL